MSPTRSGRAIRFFRLPFWVCAVASFLCNAPANADTERAFIEFHARSGPGIFGHTFIVYGRLNRPRGIVEANVVGLHSGDDNDWKGIFIPLPASISRAKHDLAGSPEIVYRRHLTIEHFYKLKAGVRRLRALGLPWHMLFLNCNDFAGEMAELIGLRRPPSLMLPVNYVALLKAIN